MLSIFAEDDIHVYDYSVIVYAHGDLSAHVQRGHHVCVCVCVCVCVSATLISYLAQLRVKQEILATSA